jgi:hypothetical protein
VHFVLQIKLFLYKKTALVLAKAVGFKLQPKAVLYTHLQDASDCGNGTSID